MSSVKYSAAGGAGLLDPFVSREQAAQFLGLRVSTLACWASDNIGPRFVKLSPGRSGACRYRLSELEAYAADPAGYRARVVAEFRPAAGGKRTTTPAAKPRAAKRGGRHNA